MAAMEMGLGASSSGELFFKMIDNCKRNCKFNKRRPSIRSDPLFRELYSTFVSFGDSAHGYGGSGSDNSSSINNSSLPQESGEYIDRLTRLDVWRNIALETKRELGVPVDYFQNLDLGSAAEADLVQIGKDVNRSGTMWDECEAQEREKWLQKLRIVLTAYAVHDRINGYCQGMNLFASELLYVTKSDELTFYLILYIVQTSKIAHGYYTQTMQGLKRDMWVVQELLDHYLPELMFHLKSHGVDISYVYIGPLLSLFSNLLPAGWLHPFYDILLTNGATTLFAAWLAFFSITKPVLMEQKSEGAITDALNLSFAEWGKVTDESPQLMCTFQRSLLQWCMILDAHSIDDFRTCAPNNLYNMDLVRRAAEEIQQEPSLKKTTTARRMISSPKRLMRNRGGVPSPNNEDAGVSSSSGDFQGEASPSASAANGLDTIQVTRSKKSETPVNLSVVWIASNLRNPFDHATAEEYRVAALETCKAILKLNGYQDILTESPVDVFSCNSPILPDTNQGESCFAFPAHFGQRKEHQPWRAPARLSATRALLNSLMSATSALLEDTPESFKTYSLLERLYMCLKTSRDAIPVYLYGDILTDELMTILTQHQQGKCKNSGSSSKSAFHWRRKLRSVFKRKNSSESLIKHHHEQKEDHWGESSSSAEEREMNSLREIWNVHIIALLLVAKVDGENESINLYESMEDQEAAANLQQLYRTIQEMLTKRIERAINQANNGKEGLSSRFSTSLWYQLKVWSLDPGAGLFQNQWRTARSKDMQQTAQAHKRFASCTASSASNARAPLPTTPFRRRRNSKTRSRSAPNVHASLPEITKLTRTSYKIPTAGKTEFGEARKDCLSESEHHRALYWALRSNLHLAQEIAQLVEIFSDAEDLKAMVEKLVTELHRQTFIRQEVMYEASRTEFIMAELEAFTLLLKRQSAKLNSTQVLLDNLQENIQFVGNDGWRLFLEAQLMELRTVFHNL